VLVTRRIDVDADDLGAGLGRLVIAVLEIVRELLERQALRRAESLEPEEVERLGRALMALDERFAELRETFGISKEDLMLPVEIADLDPNIDMGGRP
jgi:hypothetical protein